MNIFKAKAVKDLEEATRAIPVIDFAPAFLGEPDGLDRVAAQVRQASERVGFFYLAGHGVPPSTIAAAFQASREFHAMPLAEKLELRINENNIGFLPVNQSIQGASQVHKATRPNYNESFFISHDRGPDHPGVVAATPLGERIPPLLARPPDMPADHFTPHFENEAHITLRFLHYPPQEIDDAEQFGQ